MQRLLTGICLGIAMTVAILLAIVAVAQESDKLVLGRPLAVDLRQSVPVMADVVVPLDNNTSVTATVPLTLEIALQIAVSGSVNHSVQVSKNSAAVAVAPALPAVPQKPVSVNQTQPLLYDGLQWWVKSAANIGNVYDDPHDQRAALLTENAFLAVQLAVENLGHSTKEVDYDDDEWSIMLRDGAGRRFAWRDHPAACDEHDLNPGLIKSCTLLFEVPLNAQDFSVIFIAEHGYEQVISLGF